MTQQLTNHTATKQQDARRQVKHIMCVYIYIYIYILCTLTNYIHKQHQQNNDTATHKPYSYQTK